MSTYAIGDLQGCLDAFNQLLDIIGFQPGRDRLLLAGDLISRGPNSLGTLRRVYELREHLTCVLGNHDLHLLAIAHGAIDVRKKEQDLQEILDAPDCAQLLGWLQQRPLFHDEPHFDAVLVHAGIPPLWSIDQTRDRAREVEAVLRSEQASDYFNHMYGNEPARWNDALPIPMRWRVITNYLTRMRFVDQDGALELKTKGTADTPPPGCLPWFDHPQRREKTTRILFGHWAALEGAVEHENCEALDTGCVYGGALTAYRLEDGRRFMCDCG